MKINRYLLTVKCGESGIIRHVGLINGDPENYKAIEYQMSGKVIDSVLRDEIDTEDYKTDYDGLHIGSQYENDHYTKGQQIKNDGFDYVTLSYRGAWSAGSINKFQSLTAYETIGLHACTKQLIDGFISAGIPIIDYRIGD